MSTAQPRPGRQLRQHTLGNGNDIATALGNYSTITVGNGNDTINSGGQSTITAGNGNDTINVGISDAITVGNGKDNFVFNETAATQVGAVTIGIRNPS